MLDEMPLVNPQQALDVELLLEEITLADLTGEEPYEDFVLIDGNN
jgi:hypothetical protein